MRLPFRHGIVKYTVDNKKVPTFLESDPRDRYVTLRADISNVLVTFAYYDANYLFEEHSAVNNAWGPFQSGIKYWLYWDINKLTGARTFGSTIHEPIVSDTSPTFSQVRQHWFDTSEMCMKVWSGKNWTPHIRVFACTYLNGFINVYPLSTQVGSYDSCDAGEILFDDLNTPTQQSTLDDTYKFLTDISPITSSKAITTTVSLNQNLRYAIAGENITKYSLVSLKYDGTLKTASYSDPYKSPVVGIVDRDVAAGERCYYKSTMYLDGYFKQWSADPSSPLYLGLFGYINQRPPLTGYIQKVGTVVSPTVAYIDISFHNIHYESFQQQPTRLNIDVLSGKFYIKRDGAIKGSTDVFIDETIVITVDGGSGSDGIEPNPNTPTSPATPPLFPEPADPYETDNILLLTFEEDESSKKFTDLSSAGQVATLIGNPFITNTNKKFGKGSLSLDGASYLYYANPFRSIDTSLKMFSIDFWFFPTTLTDRNGTVVLGINSKASGSNVLILGKDYWVDHSVAKSNLPLGLNVWNHIAIVSDGTSMVLYLNGEKTLTTAPPVIPLSDCVLGIGVDFDTANGGTPGNHAAGFIDRFRVTAGVARFTAKFDPNTEQSSGSKAGGGVVGTPSNPVVPIPDFTGRLYLNVQGLVYNFTAKSFTWNIIHDDRLPNFVVQTYNTNNELIYPKSIKAISSSNIQISFDKPAAGTATLFIY